MLGLTLGALILAGSAHPLARPATPRAPVASASVVLQAPAPVTLAWDAPRPTDTGMPPTGYVVHFGTTCGNYPNTVDVGLVTQYTTAILPPDIYCFVVTAYDANGDTSLPSNIAPTTVGQGDPCAQPLGQFAAAVFITELRATTGAVGSQATLYFQIGSPASPVVDIMVTVPINGVDTDTDPGQHASGTRSGGVWFTTPLTPGTYPVTLTVTNASGCKAIGTHDAGGNALSVTVKEP